MYADLAPVFSKIHFKQDTKQNVWWALYDKLVVRELKTLLQGRGQGALLKV
jgi:hypothetical protein